MVERLGGDDVPLHFLGAVIAVPDLWAEHPAGLSGDGCVYGCKEGCLSIFRVALGEHGGHLFEVKGSALICRPPGATDLARGVVQGQWQPHAVGSDPEGFFEEFFCDRSRLRSNGLHGCVGRIGREKGGDRHRG